MGPGSHLPPPQNVASTVEIRAVGWVQATKLCCLYPPESTL